MHMLGHAYLSFVSTGIQASNEESNKQEKKRSGTTHSIVSCSSLLNSCYVSGELLEKMYRSMEDIFIYTSPPIRAPTRVNHGIFM